MPVFQALGQDATQASWLRQARVCQTCRKLTKVPIWRCLRCKAPCCEHLCVQKQTTKALCGHCRRAMVQL